MIPEGFAVGTVIPYAGPVDPASGQTPNTVFPGSERKGYSLRLERLGWLPCDGRAVAVARYPHLFRVIGFIYGKQDDGHFLLPDYRGRFQRGVSGDATEPAQSECPGLPRDPDADDRSPSGEGGWQGNQLGSLQCDAFQTHTHDYDKASSSGGLGYGGSGAYNINTPDQTGDPTAQPARTKEETRPKNIYVNFLIRVIP